MTNYYENLDAILGMYRVGYLKAAASNQWLLACHVIEAMAAAHPPEATVEGFVNFSYKVQQGRELEAKIKINEAARDYCEEWLPRLEDAMARWRATNIKGYNTL